MSPILCRNVEHRVVAKATGRRQSGLSTRYSTRNIYLEKYELWINEYEERLWDDGN